MARDAAELARRLTRDAEAVCRHYLSNGRREGRYWLVGDVRNTPGRSLFVRLKGAETGKGAAGKWTDAATGEHGDLLDLIRESCGLADFHDVAVEARRFLSLPRPEPERDSMHRSAPAPAGSPESARRLFAMSQPILGTVVEAYLRNRGVTALQGIASLRFHPRCYYRPDAWSPTETWPAMIAAATDLDKSEDQEARPRMNEMKRQIQRIGSLAERAVHMRTHDRCTGCVLLDDQRHDQPMQQDLQEAEACARQSGEQTAR